LKENGPETETGGMWHHLAEITWPSDRPTLVCYSSFIDIPRPTATVINFMMPLEVVKTNRKRKSAEGGATQQKYNHYLTDRPKKVLLCPYDVPVCLLPFTSF
jgi:hypothetical protein